MYVYHFLYIRLNSLISLNSLIRNAISDKTQLYGPIFSPEIYVFSVIPRTTLNLHYRGQKYIYSLTLIMMYFLFAHGTSAKHNSIVLILAPQKNTLGAKSIT